MPTHYPRSCPQASLRAVHAPVLQEEPHIRRSVSPRCSHGLHPHFILARSLVPSVSSHVSIEEECWGSTSHDVARCIYSEHVVDTRYRVPLSGSNTIDAERDLDSAS